MPEHMIEGNKLNAFTFVVACVAAIAGILFGFDTGVISGAILFIVKDFELTPFMDGWVVGSVLLGALIGSLVGGRFADHLGRRKLLIFTSFIFLAGTLASALAPSVLWLVVGRIVIGLAIGVASFTAPLYISEISPPRFRGALVSLNQLAITLGIVASYVSNHVFANHEEAWRWMLGIGVVPAVILLIGMLFLPESPRWLMLTGNLEKAKTILKHIRKTSNIKTEVEDIQNSLKQEAESRGNWKMLFEKWLRPALLIGFGLAFFQQVTGINTIIYYAPTIFEMAGFQSASQAISVTMIIGIVNVFFTVVSLFLIDKLGRRPLLLIGLAGMIFALGILSISFFRGSADLGILKWFALASMVIYIACFAISLGPIMWLMITEVFPLGIRGFGSSVAVSASWGFNMIVALTFLPLVQSITAAGTFLLFAIVSLLGLGFVYYFVPETKGVSLEEIETRLHAGERSRDLGQEVNV